MIFYTEPPPILCKDSERRAQRGAVTEFSSKAQPRGSLIIKRNTSYGEIMLAMAGDADIWHVVKNLCCTNRVNICAAENNCFVKMAVRARL